MYNQSNNAEAELREAKADRVILEARWEKAEARETQALKWLRMAETQEPHDWALRVRWAIEALETSVKEAP
jgi:hypothetical protein